MPSVIKNVIVAGATGNLGSHVVAALHAANFTISALTRPESDQKLPSYISAISTDYSLASLTAAFKGQDAVVSCVGVAGTASQIAMIDAAEQAGVKRFIPSEWGWAKDRPMLDELKQRLAEKEKVYQHLLEVCSRSKTLSWTAASTGPFVDWALTKAPALGFYLATKKARIIDGGDELVTASTGTSIGTAAAGILTHPEQTANRFVKIHSVAFTQKSMLAALEKATDASWEVENVTTAEVIEHKKALLEQKNFLGAFLDVLGQQLFESSAGRGQHVTEAESDNQLLGITVDDVDTTVASLLRA